LVCEFKATWCGFSLFLSDQYLALGCSEKGVVPLRRRRGGGGGVISIVLTMSVCLYCV